MIKGSKICGISDLDTLNFIINHPYPPQFIGFICNYKKSSRYVEVEKLNELLKLDKKKGKLLILDDIKFVNMIDLWRSVKSPKIDLSSFGHWTGTGVIDISEGLKF